MKTLDITGLQGRDLEKFIGNSMGWYPDMKVPSESDGHWERNHPKIVFSVRDIPLDIYRKLSNYSFKIDDVEFVLASVEGATRSESGRGWDGEHVSSHYPRIAITFEPRKAV